MRIIGKALPHGGTRYTHRDAVFDIIAGEKDVWLVYQYGNRVLRRVGVDARKRCVRFIAQWINAEYGPLP
jgi:phosphopentomutase